MDIKAKKSLGQNFLSNPKILERIVEAGEIGKDDTVLEIGPGTGNLTKKLADKAGGVIAIEKDHRLIEQLRDKFKSSPNVEILEADILKFDPASYLPTGQAGGLLTTSYKVVANIPYYITSHLLRTIFEGWPKPKVIILTVQKEVAQRIVSKPPDMSLLAISVQFFADPKIAFYISRESFHPRPKVDSAVIKLTSKQEPGVDKEAFFNLVKLGFSGKRKFLSNNLAHLKGKDELNKILMNLGLNTKIRAEELSLEDWIRLRNEI